MLQETKEEAERRQKQAKAIDEQRQQQLMMQIKRKNAYLARLEQWRVRQIERRRAQRLQNQNVAQPAEQQNRDEPLRFKSQRMQQPHHQHQQQQEEQSDKEQVEQSDNQRHQRHQQSDRRPKRERAGAAGTGADEDEQARQNEK